MLSKQVLSIMKRQQSVLSSPIDMADSLQPMNVLPSSRASLSVLVRIHLEEGASEPTDLFQPRFLSRLCRADILIAQVARGR